MSTTTAGRHRSPAAAGPEHGSRIRAAGELRGIAGLVRLALRRDRIWWPAWIVPVCLYVGATAGAFEALYPTIGSREELSVSMASNPTLRALYGLPHDLSTAGGFTSWRIGSVTSVVVALMSILTVLRHTREEEESGRLELLRSGVVGRHAALTSAVLVTTAANLVLALGVAGALVAAGAPAAGAFALGLGFAGVGLVFTGVAAVTAQLSESTRACQGIAGTALGVAFLLQSIGATGAGTAWMTWTTPLGWANQVQPYAGDRFVVLLLPVALLSLLYAAGRRLEARRDLAAGVLATRLGPPHGRIGSRVGAARGLAWRLGRGGLLGWTVGLMAAGYAVGSLASGIVDLFEDNPTLRELITQLGGQQGITDAYIAATLPFLAAIASAQSISAVQRLRTEEDAGRAELVLSGPLTRTRLALSHAVLGLAGPVAVVSLMGLAAGAGYAVSVGEPAGVWRVAAAALVSLPAVWTLTGLVVLCVGASRRLDLVPWMAYAACLLMGQIGQLLRLPGWVLSLSPFRHLPRLPAEAVEPLPLVLMAAIASAFVVGGIRLYGRRDLG